MWMIPGRVAELLLLSWRVGRGMEELCWVTVWMIMFESGRAPSLQPTFSYRRWKGSGAAVLSKDADDTC